MTGNGFRNHVLREGSFVFSMVDMKKLKLTSKMRQSQLSFLLNLGL